MLATKKTWAPALIAAALWTAPFSSAWAGDAEDALIAKVTKAYGGARLTGLRSIRMQDDFANAFPGQGYTSGYVEFTPLAQDTQIDLIGGRGSQEAWSANWNFTFNARTVSVGDDIVAINYNAGNYQPAAFADFYAAFGAAVRISDTLLAYELTKETANAEYKGAQTYLGRPHELITFEMPQSPPLTLYVDAASGFITRMTRETGFGALSYQFDDHKMAGGVGYASRFDFFVGEDANLVSHSRQVTVNAVRSAVFSIDRGIAAEPARVDTAEMTVDKVADGVHLAGVGNAYTAFIDAGDYVIGVGGYAGLADRFTAYKEAAGTDKPLRYQIVTHHHTDHLGGMADALALGAVFVTPANAVANLRTAAGADISDDRIEVLDGERTLGPVRIYDITTSHAESFALVYLPGPKIAFQADHYNGVYAEAPSSAGIGTVTLAAEIKRLDLDVATLLSAHGRKASAWAEVESALAAYDPAPCPSGRPICR